MIFIRIIAFLALSGSSQQGGNKMYTISCGGKNLIDRPPVADNMEHNLSLKIWIFNECFCESNYVIQILPIFTILNTHASPHLSTRFTGYFLGRNVGLKMVLGRSPRHLLVTQFTLWKHHARATSYCGPFLVNLALLEIHKVENQQCNWSWNTLS